MRHLYLVCAVVALTLASAQPPLPTLPQTFSADFTVELVTFLRAEFPPLFKGSLTIDRDAKSKTCGGLYLAISNNADANLPYLFETSYIMAPSGSVVENYLYLSQGRCWDMGGHPAEVACFPLALPDDSSYGGKIIIDGEVCSVWSITLPLNPRVIFAFANITLRDRDNAIMRVDMIVPGSAILSFIFEGFTTKIQKGDFAAPPGPCPPRPSASASPMKVLARMIGHATPNLNAQHKIMAVMSNIFGMTMEEEIETAEPLLSSNDIASPPSPPVLHDSFSTDLHFGYGSLKAQENYIPHSNYFFGHLAIDALGSGLYLSLSDDSSANVPWMYNTSFIGVPDRTQSVDGYAYLSYGHCWAAANPFDVRSFFSFSLQIPRDAEFGGIQEVYGKKASLWSFWFIEGQVQIAVDVATSTPLFINNLVGRYIVFENYDGTRPDPSLFTKPSGPCPVVWEN